MGSYRNFRLKLLVFGLAVSVLDGCGGKPGGPTAPVVPAGGVGAKTDFATGTSPHSVAIGDVSGDGKPDLTVANAGSNSVSVLLWTVLK